MRSSRTLGFTFAFCLAVSALAVAQPAGYVSVTSITVRPSAVSEFEDYAKKINAASTKIGAPGNAYLYATARGGRSFNYVVVSPFTKWADLDARPSIPEILTKAYGEREGNRILKAGRATLEGVESRVLRVLPELSSPPAPTGQPAAHAHVFVIEVKPGMASTFEAFLAKLKAAQDKAAGIPPVIRHASVLGPSNVYVSVYFF